ncbi:carbonic anhydrase [Roseomonas frigidaquae]|uniref:Carbonic anhydrase n=1 Tax=Falsiroseomonas frigidaquae TaxID=487318 RepID=A0ABX1F263_9PROT|nr:carbonic anhydrase [Falsiroseomonas frigidaquae]NKE46420.1 carbonic anhydrase [Falsiroseomonas frigidaquae]
MPACPCCSVAFPHRTAPHPAGPGRGRRGLMAAFAGLAAGAATGFPLARPARASSGLPPTTLTPDQALERLMQGNQRYLAQAPQPGPGNRDRRAILATGQAPFAAVLGCADSRAAPEVLFQAGLGDIFVARNAGNLADTGAIGSLEYAVSNLGVPLIMVLGHEHCGAAGAAVALAQQPLALPAHLRDMLLPMLPAALAALRAGGDTVEGTVRLNVALNVSRLLTESPVLAAAATAERLKIVGAYYDLDTQQVSAIQ